MIVLIIAVASGFVGFLLMINVMKGSSHPVLSYVIAAKTIPKDKVIDASDAVMSKPLKNYNPSDLFLQVSDVVGSAASQEFAKGNLIYRNQVYRNEQKAQEGPVSLPIPEGMRAFGFGSTEVESMPGDIQVGSYLDILGLMPNYEGKMESQTVVRGAQVISIVKDKSYMSSLTVALTPRATEVVTRAIDHGKVRLILRPDKGEKTIYQAIGFTEIIRGVNKEKNLQSDRNAI